MNRLICLALLALACCAPSFADTTWVADSTITYATWSADHSPYMIQTNVRVFGGLQIGPGVTAYFTGPYSLTVSSHACLMALGTASDSIRFTTDTLSNPDRWYGVSIDRGRADSCRFDYCIIEFSKSDSSVEHSKGLYAYDTDLRISNCTFRYCGAHTFRGGGLGVEQGWLTMESCHVVNNSGTWSVTLAGGGLVENCLIEGNDGGGVRIDTDDSLTVSHCVIRNNQAENGGGLRLMSNSVWQLNITGCDISGNRAHDGGGICGGAANADIRECTFSNNHADSSGGAIWHGELAFRYCLFDGNTAAIGGACADVQGAGFNCTFVNNQAPQGGAAIYTMIGFGATLYNTIVAFNRQSPAISFGAIPIHWVSNCLLFGNEDGDFTGYIPPFLGEINRTNPNGDSCDYHSNLFQNPLFADTTSGNYHLTAQSPCIDAGDSRLSLDPDSTIADIGAYYFPHPDAVEPSFILQPSAFILSVYPNPFNPSTRITYDLPVPANVRLRIFDVLGRETAVLVDDHMNAGRYSIEWNAQSFPSGTYFVVMQAADKRFIQRMLLLK